MRGRQKGRIQTTEENHQITEKAKTAVPQTHISLRIAGRLVPSSHLAIAKPAAASETPSPNLPNFRPLPAPQSSISTLRRQLIRLLFADSVHCSVLQPSPILATLCKFHFVQIYHSIIIHILSQFFPSLHSSLTRSISLQSPPQQPGLVRPQLGAEHYRPEHHRRVGRSHPSLSFAMLLGAIHWLTRVLAEPSVLLVPHPSATCNHSRGRVHRVVPGNPGPAICS